MQKVLSEEMLKEASEVLSCRGALELRLQRIQAVSSAVLACSFWGVSFVAPHALPEVSSSAIAFFRFFFFGGSSFFYLIARRKSLPRLDRAQLREALLLAWSGYSLYYLCLSLGVKGIGVPFATAIVGLLPLTILLASTPLKSLRHFLFPLTLLATGAVLVPSELFSESYGALLERSAGERASGLLSAVVALALWTFFAVRNAAFLRRYPQWKPLDWASMLGVIAGFSSAFLFIREEGFVSLVGSFGNTRLLFWTAFMGIGGAWVATALWNRASRILSAAFVGQLLVFESVFGLLYAFFYEGRVPRLIEWVSIALLLAGALLAMRKLLPLREQSS